MCEPNNHKFEPLITKDVMERIDNGRATVHYFDTVLFCGNCGFRVPVTSTTLQESKADA